MGTDEEIRTAEQKLIEVARKVARGECYGVQVLVDRVAELDALKSPLPSREAMVARHLVGTARHLGARFGEIAEWHWVDALRWVATQSGHCEEPGDIVESGPWGDGCFYCWIKSAADELEGRGK